MANEPVPVITRNITVDPDTDAIVVQAKVELANITGTENYSAAIRFIVREWAANKAAMKSNKRAQASA